MEKQHLRCTLLNNIRFAYGFSSVFFKDILPSPLELVQHDSWLRINFSIAPHIFLVISRRASSRMVDNQTV